MSHLLSIGVMTGNSLDGVDVVLTKIEENGSLEDIESHSVPNPPELSTLLKNLRGAVKSNLGDVDKTEKAFDVQGAHQAYINSVGSAVKELIAKAQVKEADIIGFHGQTCAHFPPSMTGGRPEDAYTVQFGDGGALADITGIPVVYDFRSDDIMSGGEGAPLAPRHHHHLAKVTAKKGHFPIAFLNAGNTGNISVISLNEAQQNVTLGWDAGPCNHFTDLLMQREGGAGFDTGGKRGSKGKVLTTLLKNLFDNAAPGTGGKNFLEMPLPKSSDPEWYVTIDALSDSAIKFEDRLRTAQYFAVYILFHSFSLLPSEVALPKYLALCGGGWKNDVMREHFMALIAGDTEKSPILPEHAPAFKSIHKRQSSFICKPSSFYGFSEQSMEARIFSDAAVARVKGEPFTTPAVTGARKPCVLGIIRFPHGSVENSGARLKSWLEKYQTLQSTADHPHIFNPRWSRASSGWYRRINP